MANCTELYVHYVWARWDRLPLVTEDCQEQIYASIIAKCHELKCEVVVIGGIEDHVHLLVRLPATITISELIKEVKGASSHLMTHALKPGVFFKWQGSYGAFTVSKQAVSKVAEYIRQQKEHHASGSLIPYMERCEELWASNTNAQ